MFSDAQRFAWDLEGLQRIAKNPSPPNLLEASNILRRLFLDDGQPLVHKVSRMLGMTPSYRIPVFEKAGIMSPPGLNLDERNLAFSVDYPLAAITSETNVVNIDELLKTPVYIVSGIEITIKQLIKYCAEVGGGVHQGIPRKKHNAEVIHGVLYLHITNGYPYLLYILTQIIAIAVEALIPLYKQILKASSSPIPPP